MDSVIDFYTIDRRTDATSDDEAKAALSSGVLMNLSIDEGWNWWITLFKLVDFQLGEHSVNLSVVDMGTRPYSVKFRKSTLEPIFDPVPLGVIEGTDKVMHALALKNGAMALGDAVSHLLPQGKDLE